MSSHLCSSSEDRLHPHQVPPTPDDRDGLIIIRQQQHQYFGFQSFQSFVLSGKVLEGWQFNVDGALPLHTGLEILADGPHGPIIFKFQETSLHIACSLTNHHTSQPIKQLLRNYYSHLFHLIRSRNSLGNSLHHFLFIQHQGDLSESSKISSHQAPPLTSLSIKSKLKNGPKLIFSPVTEIHETPHLPVDTPDLTHIIGPPKLGTTRVFRQQYRDPYRMKHLRLQQVFKACYGENRTKELKDISENIRMKFQEQEEEEEKAREMSRERERDLRSHSQGPSPTSSRPISPSSPSSRPTSPPRHGSAGPGAGTSDRCATTAGRYYEASNRALIVQESYRRSQTAGPGPGGAGHGPSPPHGPPATRPMRSQNPCHRINWKSDWKNVRGSDGDPLPLGEEEGEEKGKGQCFSSRLEEEAKLSFLPMNHPLSRPSTTPGLGLGVGVGHGSSFASVQSVYQGTNAHPPPSPVVTTRILLRPQTAGVTGGRIGALGGAGGPLGSSLEGTGTGKPYCSYREHEKRIQKESEIEYRGVFRGGYLTPYEKERKEYSELQKKFLSGSFKSCVGKASEMPLRREGGVQAHGPYPAPIASDKERTKGGKYGAWKPTVDLYKVKAK
jgi:hypothetical protein